MSKPKPSKPVLLAVSLKQFYFLKGIAEFAFKQKVVLKDNISIIQKRTHILMGIFGITNKYPLALKRIALVVSLSCIFGVSYLVTWSPAHAYAATTNTVNFQARLENASGSIVPDGTYNAEFKIYNTLSTGGTAQGVCTGNCLWYEDYLVGGTPVSVSNGYMTVNLGSQTAFPTTIPWGSPLYLTINIGGTGGSPSWDGEMSPRLTLTAVPAAFSLESAAGSFTSTLNFVQPTANESILLPADGGATEYVCYQGDATNCGYIADSSTQQAAANFNIANEGQLATLDATGSAGSTLTIGGAVTYTGAINIDTNASVSSGTVTIGGTAQTGAITVGQATTSTQTVNIESAVATGGTQTVNIDSNNDTASTQTVNIATGTSTTSGAKNVNIATGTPGSGTSTTVDIGNGGGANGTVSVLIGSNGNAAHTTTIQGGNGASAISLQAASGGIISIGTNATNPVNIGVSAAPTYVAQSHNSGTAVNTVSVTSVNAGDILLLATKGNINNRITSVTGGGVSAWHMVTYFNGYLHEEIWEGTVTTPGTSTVTANYLGAGCSGACEMTVQEFSSTYGASTNWSVTTAGQQQNTVAGNISFPSLTASETGGLYWGYGYTNGSATGSGSNTAVFTYVVLPSTSNSIAYATNVTKGTAYAPVANSSSNTSDGLAVIVTDSTSSINIDGTTALEGAVTSPLVVAGTANSTLAFQVQNASGSPAFGVDTVNNLVTSYDTLQVGPGATTTAPKFLYLADVTSNTTGNAQIIGQWDNANNWGIGANSNSTSDNALRIGTTTGNGVNAWNTSQNINLTVAGTETVQPTTGNDSANAFQVDNAAGTYSLLDVNTLNTNLTSSSTLNSVNSPREWSVLESTTIGTPGSTTQTLAVAPHTVGNVMVLAVGITSTSYTVNTVAGGGVTTWTKINANNLSTSNRVELWYGTVTSTGASNITVTYSGTDSVPTELVNQEFTAGLGSATTWAVTTSNVASDGSATTMPFPSLTSGSNSGGMYVGYGMEVSNDAGVGTTSGFTYEPTPTAYDMYLYNPDLNASTAYAPVATITGASTSNVIAAIITASANDSVGIDGSTVVGGANSQAAFEVQNGAGATVLDVDSADNIINLEGGYSGTIGTWQSDSNSLPNIMATGDAVTADGYVFDEAGNDNGTVDGKVYSAQVNPDGTVGAWSTLSSVPSTPVKFDGAVASNGYLYELGGNNGSADQSTVQYAQIEPNGTLGNWSTTTPFPSNTTVSRTTAVAANGYIYVIGGSQNGSDSTNVYYGKVNANGTISSWNTGGALTAAAQDMSAVYVNGYIVVTGGGNGTTSSTTVQTSAVNATTGANSAFSTTGDAVLPGARAQASVGVANGYVYVVGGRSADNSNSPQTGTYYGQLNSNGQIGSWNSVTTTYGLPIAVFGQTMVTVNGYLILMGGFNSSGTLTNGVYSSTTARVALNASLDLVGSSSGSLVNGGDQSTGSAGGSLTAGDTTIVGSLQVADQANFNQGVDINGNLTASDTDITSTDTTGTGLTVTGNSITTGNVVNIASTSAVQSGSGALLNVSDTASLVTSGASDTGSILNIGRTLTANVSGSSTLTPTVDHGATFDTYPASTTQTDSFIVNSGYSNYYMVIGVFDDRGNPAPTVTYAGVSATLLESGGIGTGSVGVYLYGLVAPATGANNLVVSGGTNSGEWAVAVEDFYNVNQTTPYANATSAKSNTAMTAQTVTTVSGDVVADFLAETTPPITVGSGQTAVNTSPNYTMFYGPVGTVDQSTKPAVGTSTTMVWNSPTYWGWEAIDLKGSTATNTETVTSPVATISNNCIQTSGTCGDTTNVLSLNQQFANAGGAVLNINNSGTGYGLQLQNGSNSTLFAVGSTGDLISNSNETTGTAQAMVDNAITTGNGLNLSANALTTGNGANLSTTSNVQTAGSLLNLADTATLGSNGGSYSGQLLNINRSLTANIGTVGEAITHAGGPTNSSSTSAIQTRTQSVTTSNIGDLVFMTVLVNSSTITVSSITNGSNTGAWTQLNTAYDATHSDDLEVWYATATAASSQNATVHLSAVPPSIYVEITTDSFHGAGTPTWNIVKSSHFYYAGDASKGVDYPTMSPTAANQEYWGESDPQDTYVSNTNALTGFTSVIGGSTGLTGTTYNTSSITNGVNYTPTGAQNTASAYSNNWGVIFEADVSGGGSANVLGSAANISSNCTSSTGTCSDSSNVLSLNQQYSSATGAVLGIKNSGTGLGIQVQNSSGANIFSVDTTTDGGADYGRIVIGSGSGGETTPVLLVLDSKNSTGDPTGAANGAIYYNTGGTGGAAGIGSGEGVFRCYQGGAWRDCLGMQDFSQRRFGFRTAAGGGMSATTMTSTNLQAPSVTGTAAANAQSESYYISFTNTASAGLTGDSSLETDTKTEYLPKFETRVRLDPTAITGATYWIGLGSLNMASLTPPTTSVAEAASIASVAYESTVNGGDFLCVTADGTNMSGTNMGVAAATGSYYDIIVDASISGNVTCSISTNGGAFVSVTKTTNMPAAASNLGMQDSLFSSGSSRAISVAYQYLEYN